MTIYNFSAGPAVLPKEVLQQAQAELIDWHGSGMSVMEMSHRGKEYMGIHAQAEADLRELMGIPANYKVLFLQGGAHQQFSMIPLNLLRGKLSADYVNTGEWSKKAIGEAKKFSYVNVVADNNDKKCTYVPAFDTWKLDKDAAYVHYTPNETIGGVEFNWIPNTGEVPLVADMSSNILSRPVRCLEVRADLRRCAEEHRPGRSDHRDRARRPGGPCPIRACRPCWITRRMPITTPCTTRRPLLPSTWPGWCSSG